MAQLDTSPLSYFNPWELLRPSTPFFTVFLVCFIDSSGVLTSPLTCLKEIVSSGLASASALPQPQEGRDLSFRTHSVWLSGYASLRKTVPVTQDLRIKD